MPIFPRLHVGNNTYNAGAAVAFRLVLQAYASRRTTYPGALVDDIVNTAAITAIQAQGRVHDAAPCRASPGSSLKFQLVEPVAGMSRAAGIVE